MNVLTSNEKQYKAEFVKAHSQPYAVQNPAKSWKTKHKTVSDLNIKAHLHGNYWVGLKAPWYPTFFSLDIDSPTPDREEKIQRILEDYHISESQILRMSTPSHREYGNYRIYLRLEYREKPPTWKLGYTALSNIFGNYCEIYPQENRKDRLPCGREQDILTADGLKLTHYTWETEMHWLLKIDPTAIDNLPFQPKMFEEPLFASDNPKIFTRKTDVKDLLENGLQGFGTRHEAQFGILNYCWLKNSFENESIEFVWRWLLKKHHGFSREINRGNLQAVREEIKRQAAWIWKRHKYLPDAPHNLQGKVFKSDLRYIAEVFPGNAVRQKQFFNLISFYRARQHHEFVFISSRLWEERIAHRTTYLDFQRELELKGLLETDRRYKVKEYSRRYKLILPTPAEEEPIQTEERHIDNYYEALQMSFANRREIQQMTGLNKMSLWRNLTDLC